ncbi:MAG: acetylglutamate kinase, partial [Desulfovibrio sp.]|nr:acetylglutamate kinase [Desulfovibrio sp.]
MDVAGLREAFFANLRELTEEGMKFVIVHGGGPKINNLLKRLDIKSSFIRGLRVTDEQTLEAVEMALCGQVNKELVRDLSSLGLKPVGISGEDANLLIASQIDPELGRVGKIERVDIGLVSCLLNNDYLPVVSPLALDEKGDLLNVNADVAAGAIAAALKADYFILVSDVPGVLDKDGRLFSYLKKSAIEELIASGVINGGMIPKVEACLESREKGCEKAFLLDGRKENSLKDYLRNFEMAGT